MTLDGDPTEPLKQTATSVALVLGNDEQGSIVRVLAGTVGDGQDMVAVIGVEAQTYVITLMVGGSASAGDIVHITPELAAGATLCDPACPVTVVSGGPHLS
jgi:hypothetical protein